MPVEILPKLVRMYNELSKDVPLIWPKNPVSVKYYLVMKELGHVIDGNRTLVTTELNTVIRANKLYHAYDENFPHKNILEYLNLNKKPTEGMAILFPHALKRSTSIINSKIITLIDRKANSRNVKNHEKILQRLKKTFPQHHVREFVIQPFEPSLYLQQVAKV
ncbi:hypothetical protein FDP41_002761 [Naegleria fowleri]|uniref:Uncharacterized protein n=1 Tax=Naegleria fowleri TaxID=5763 RepID=A0A6A5BSS3_NAEFO|nr:uncharacterized protein FDP41_002761 [Naegleria fowleri]KAF0978246.1 hypothetical protein FDP41_002761 [Naegleria fowleri]CAG4710115.1 unnamed protein product [Naegleria fowleri]